MKKEGILTLLLFCAFANRGITQSLLRDINTTTLSAYFSSTAVVLNGKAFFGASDTNGKGNELWMTDGSSGGTALFKDIYAGEWSSFPANFLPLSGQFLFTVQDSLLGGDAVFTSDGTAAGTLPLLFNNQPVFGSQFVPANGWVYFTAYRPDNKVAILRTDGTTQGTVELAVTAPNTGIIETPVIVGNRVYYITESFDYTYTLMRTDGTLQGTVALKSITQQEGMFGLAAAGNTAYCWVDSPLEGFALWKSDGSAAGTTLLVDLEPGQKGGKPSSWVSTDNYLFFIKDSGTGSVCWRTDGNLAGTIAISQPLPDAANVFVAGNTVYVAGYALYASSFDGPLLPILDMDQGVQIIAEHSLVALNGNVYFVAVDAAHGGEIWKSDGTEAGTKLVRDINPGPDNSAAKPAFILNNQLYWVAFHPFWGSELWSTDNAGTSLSLAVDINTNTNSSDAYDFKSFGSVTLFSADDGREGRELWQHFPGSNLVADLDLNPGPAGSYPNECTRLNNQVIFQAFDSLYGVELWRYDLVNNEAGLLADLNPGPGNAGPYNLTWCAGKVLFSNNFISTVNVYATDGTTAGTGQIGSSPDYNVYNPVCLQNDLFFSTVNADLLKINGSGGGIILVKDFDVTAGSGYVLDMTAFKNRIFFSAPDQAHGQELWVSDGTLAGTVLFDDFIPGPANSGPAYLTVVDSLLYFRVWNEAYGVDLWRTDGTVAGTVKLSSVAPPLSNLEVGGFHAADGLLYFLTGDVNGYNTSLWRSDGTTAGTFILHDFNQIIFHTELFPMGSSVYFNGSDPQNGYELWVSNGSVSGTKLVSDLCPGTCSGDPRYFGSSDSLLYFTAYQPLYGREPWTMKIGTSSVPPPIGATAFSMQILGNPAQSGSLIGINLHVDHPVATAFNLYDVTGRMVWQKVESSKEGENIYHFLLPALSPGIYLLQATAGPNRRVEKVMIAR